MNDPELVRRVRAVETTERHFTGKSWRPGSVDCAQLAIFHLKRFGWRMPRIERYRTIEEGRARLSALGAETMADVLDQIGLPRRAPASALIADLVMMPGEGPLGGLGALGIAIGNGVTKVFHDDHDGLVSFRTANILAAWNVSP